MQSDYFDGILFINLDYRTDRRGEIENELENFGLVAERFTGIRRAPGIVGCGESHLACLKIARDRGWKNVLIFEDDFTFLVSREEFWGALKRFFDDKIEYDVLMFSYNMRESEPFNDYLLKVNFAATASGYVVNKSMYDPLINLYETNIPLLAATGKHWIYANDMIWKTLQPISRWYAFTPRLGRQRPSFSDNSNSFADHNL